MWKPGPGTSHLDSQALGKILWYVNDFSLMFLYGELIDRGGSYPADILLCIALAIKLLVLPFASDKLCFIAT